MTDLQRIPPAMSLPPDTLAERAAYLVSGDVVCTENWPAIRDAIVKRCQETVEAERERCAKIVDNLARIFSTHYPDPKPEFNTAVAAFALAHTLAETAADAIRDPVQTEKG
jgi:hypothetical protein